MKKSKEEILNANSDELSTHEKFIKHQFLLNPHLTLKEANQKIVDIDKDITEAINSLKHIPGILSTKGKVFLYISTFFFTFLFCIWVFLILSLADIFFNPNEVISPLVICGYSAILILSIYYLLSKWNEKAKLIQLGIRFIGFLFGLTFLLWVTGLNLNLEFNRVIMLNDKEYIENEDYDEDLYTSSSGSYSWENKFFLEKDLLKDGEYYNDSIQIDFDYNKDKASIKLGSNEAIYLNAYYCNYWQYAYIEGYVPIGKSYNTKGLINNSFNIISFYLLEIILTAIPKGFAFSILILILTIFYGYDITKED